MSAATRQSLLTVSAAQFAKDGLIGTSVRELAELADVNVAAISYHFGGKEGLYQATLQYVMRREGSFWTFARERQEVAAQMGTRGAAEEALRQHILEFVQLLFEQEVAFTLMLREMMEPTEAMQQIVAELIGPNNTILRALVGQMQPSLQNTKRLDAFCRNIIGQCVHLRVARSLIASLQQRDKLDEEFLQQAAAHIAEFSISALRNWEDIAQ